MALLLHMQPVRVHDVTRAWESSVRSASWVCYAALVNEGAILAAKSSIDHVLCIGPRKALIFIRNGQSK